MKTVAHVPMAKNTHPMTMSLMSSSAPNMTNNDTSSLATAHTHVNDMTNVINTHVCKG